MKICNPIRRTACVLALSACAAAPTLAADSGYYLGASVGQSTYDKGDVQIYAFPIPTGSSTDENDTAFSLSGGYRFNRYIGVDLSLNDFGDLSQTATGFLTLTPSTGGYADAYVGTRGLSLAAVGTLPLGKFEAYAKAGAIYAESKGRGRITPTFGTWPAGSTGVATLKSKSTQLLYGVGAGYTFGEQVFVKLDYTAVPKLGVEEDFDFPDDLSVSVISIGFEFRF